MKEIALSKGKVALVDDEDYQRVMGYKWYAMETQDGDIYAVHRTTGICMLMHRFILSVPSNKEVDHRDHDGLNNQRYNLRECTSGQNKANQRKKQGIDYGRTSRFKGVCWYPNYGNWRATINKEGQQYSLGYHATEEQAARAYNAAARRLFGEFALLNVIPA